MKENITSQFFWTSYCIKNAFFILVLFISVDSLQFDGLVLCYVTQGLVQASYEMKVDDVTRLSSYRYGIFTTKQPNSFKKVQDLMSALVFQTKKKKYQFNACYLTFPKKHHYMNVLHRTTPMDFRYYHLQSYVLRPPWAAGITAISLTNYYPLKLPVLPTSAISKFWFRIAYL